MKKLIYLLLGAVISSVITGCTASPGTSDRINNQTSQVDQVIQQQVEKTEVQKTDEIETTPVTPTDTTDQITATPVQITDVPEQSTEIPEQITENPEHQTNIDSPEYEKVDVDLTELSSTLIYSDSTSRWTPLLFSYTLPTIWACSGLPPIRARPWRAN